jgi:hypothetical protein
MLSAVLDLVNEMERTSPLSGRSGDRVAAAAATVAATAATAVAAGSSSGCAHSYASCALIF